MSSCALLRIKSARIEGLGECAQHPIPSRKVAAPRRDLSAQELAHRSDVVVHRLQCLRPARFDQFGEWTSHCLDLCGDKTESNRKRFTWVFRIDPATQSQAPLSVRILLQQIIATCKNAGIRVSIFVDPVENIVAAARLTGTDRIELYTEGYARNYSRNKEEAVAAYIKAAAVASANGLGINAGHDLDRQNLKYFAQSIPALLEVSIGHALISDALYYGLENVVQMYRRCLVV